MKKIIYLILMIVIAYSAEAQIRYHVTDLSEQAMSNGSDIIPSVGYCINNNGDVAGHGMPTAVGSESKPFFYDANTGAFVNLGNLAGSFIGGKGGNGYCINEAGCVVGRNSISDGSWNYRPFLFKDANYNNAVDAGEMLNLTIDADYEYGWAESINDAGQVIGFSRDVNDDYYGWLWTDLNDNNLPDIGEKQFFADFFPCCINNSADIVLTYGINGYLWADTNSNGIYDAEELQMMPMPDGYQDEVLGCFVVITEISPVVINNTKVICGAAENCYGKANGFFWLDSNQNGLIETEEYTLFGSALKQTHVRAMNNCSQVAGGTYEYTYTYNPGQKQRSAFIWSKQNGMTNLNDVADTYTGGIGNRWLSQVEGINEKGQLVVSGWFDEDNNGKQTTADPEHAFVLTPYLRGDITGDGKVNMADYVILSRYYLQNASAYPAADIDGSLIIDIFDLMILSADWLEEINSCQ